LSKVSMGKIEGKNYETNSMFNMHRNPRADAHGVGSTNETRKA